METILAVDIKKGKAVKAFAGFRLNYKPLMVNSLDYSDPIKLIRTILKKMDLKKIYLADLDSIQNLKPNDYLIEKILITVPEINFLIDSGFDYPITIERFCNQLRQKNIINFQIVVGTEKIKNYNFRNFFSNSDSKISIDFNGTQKKWFKKIKKLKNKPELILMFLKKIGGRGIEWKQIRNMIKLFPENSFTVAGGVKYENQKKKLSVMGVDAVIVSTLIHRKYLGTNNPEDTSF